jgi:hypothetical protein
MKNLSPTQRGFLMARLQVAICAITATATTASASNMERCGKELQNRWISRANREHDIAQKIVRILC